MANIKKCLRFCNHCVSLRFTWPCQKYQIYFQNKKVFLCERKRHTDRGVSSTPSVNRSGVPPLSGTPPARSDRGYLRLGTPVRYPHSQVRRGHPRLSSPHSGTPSQVGYHLARSDRGVPNLRYPLLGTPPSGPGWVPPPTWTWLGYCPLGVDRQTDGWTRVKTLPSRRTTYAVCHHTGRRLE